MAKKAPGSLAEQHKPALPAEMYHDLLRKMLTVYYVEERMKVFVRRASAPSTPPRAGTKSCRSPSPCCSSPGKDWFFPYYREKALMVGLGMPLKDIFLRHALREGRSQLAAAATCPSTSRRGSCARLADRLHGHAVPAGGRAWPRRSAGRQRRGRLRLRGEGATSEGEFFEALNWAGREALPVLFVIQNNGYAISVPQEVQTPSEIHRSAWASACASHQVDGRGSRNDVQRLSSRWSTSVRKGGGPAPGRGARRPPRFAFFLGRPDASTARTRRSKRSASAIRIAQTELQLLARS